MHHLAVFLPVEGSLVLEREQDPASPRRRVRGELVHLSSGLVQGGLRRCKEVEEKLAHDVHVVNTGGGTRIVAGAGNFRTRSLPPIASVGEIIGFFDDHELQSAVIARPGAGSVFPGNADAAAMEPSVTVHGSGDR